MIKDWEWSKADDAIAEELKANLPERIFDVHAHVYSLKDMKNAIQPFLKDVTKDGSIALWRECVERQISSGKLIGGLFFPMPALGLSVESANEYLAQQLLSEPNSRGLLLVSPESEVNQLLINNPQICGFKPYHLFSHNQPSFQAEPKEYIPEWVWEIAHDKSWIIMLHLVRDKALNDPANINYLNTYCRKYPQAKVVLAHAGRGFNAWNTIKGVKAIYDLQNVWFDSSAVTEPSALTAILKTFGPRKLMWGSDFPFSEQHGFHAAAGNSFIWVSSAEKKCYDSEDDSASAMLGLESLRNMLYVLEEFGANANDKNDVFCDNARRLLGLMPECEAMSQALYRHAKEIIPAGTQLLSKRPEMVAPNQWPPYYREARGCEIIDLDGKHYYDFYINGVGACLLGYNHPDVNKAVMRRVNMGSMCTLNPPEEVELADRLCKIHPWAEAVRFARGGGEACSIAVRIARATTDRSIIAICGYHGWTDFYLAANLGENNALRGHLLPGLEPLGVPTELRGTTVHFHYNNLDEFRDIISKYGDRLAGVIMEPCRYADPHPGFLEAVREETAKCGAMLIFDEITIGWRLHFGGAHLKYNIQPDMAVFAKALGNGYPISAIIGTKKAMEGAHSSFISSTNWTEGIGPTAALAVIDVMERVKVHEHAAKIGAMIIDCWKKRAEETKAPVVAGYSFPCLASFKFDHPQANELRTYFAQLMLERGFLASTAVYPTLGHTEEIVAEYDKAVGIVFDEIAQAVSKNDIADRLKGPVAHSGFQRLV